MAPSGQEGSARRYMKPVSVLRCLEPGGTCPPLGGPEAAVLGGTCPPPGDFDATTLGCWFCRCDLQGCW